MEGTSFAVEELRASIFFTAFQNADWTLQERIWIVRMMPPGRCQTSRERSPERELTDVKAMFLEMRDRL
jgi:hypothetical protein